MFARTMFLFPSHGTLNRSTLTWRANKRSSVSWLMSSKCVLFRVRFFVSLTLYVFFGLAQLLRAAKDARRRSEHDERKAEALADMKRLFPGVS